MTAKLLSMSKPKPFKVRMRHLPKPAKNLTKKLKKLESSNRRETMIRGMRSSMSLKTSSPNLRKGILCLLPRMLSPYSILVHRSERESSIRHTYMSGFLQVIIFSSQMLISRSNQRSTHTWSKEQTLQRSKALKLKKLQRLFRPNLRPFSLGQSTSKSTQTLHLSIWKSRNISRVFMICLLRSLFASKTSGPKPKTRTS